MELNYSVIDVKSSFKLPYEFIGSTIRGVLGIALKKVLCINPSYECKGCFAKDNCVFYDLYESNFAKFRLKISLNGKLLAINEKGLLYNKQTKRILSINEALYERRDKILQREIN